MSLLVGYCKVAYNLNIPIPAYLQLRRHFHENYVTHVSLDSYVEWYAKSLQQINNDDDTHRLVKKIEALSQAHPVAWPDFDNIANQLDIHPFLYRKVFTLYKNSIAG